MSHSNSRQVTGLPALWRCALVLLALLATGAQQLVVQTHWHAAVAQVHSGAGISAPQDGASRHADCLWCQAAAHASALAPPAALQALLAPHRLPVSPTTFQSTAPHPEPVHDWQSRGPPVI